MSCLQLPAPAAMRAWRRGLISARRLGRLRSGHVDVVQGRQPAGLRKEVRTCEYSDVHVLWDMLSGKPSTSSRGKGKSAAAARAGATRLRATTTGRKPAIVAAAAAWSRLTFYCCGII